MPAHVQQATPWQPLQGKGVELGTAGRKWWASRVALPSFCVHDVQGWGCGGPGAEVL